MNGGGGGGGAVLSFPTDYKARMLFNWTVARELRKKNEISEPRFWLKHFTISTFTHSHLIVKEQRAISCNEILKKQLFFNLEWCRVLQGEKWGKKELRSFHKLLLFRTSITHFYIPAVAQVWPPSTRLISPLGERSLEPEAPGSKLCAPIFSDKAGDVY